MQVPQHLKRSHQSHSSMLRPSCLLLRSSCHPRLLPFPSDAGQVNELDGIPLILDNCNISDSNPFLTQWVIYAIRNLTEDNSQNQDLIAKMEEQGLADASLLKKVGFEVEKKGEKLILKSTRDTPKPVSTLEGTVLPFGL
uniref:Ataxin 10 n=4 Tax=Hominidae TaxID=9604 RepID=A0A2I3RDE5_PANTR